MQGGRNGSDQALASSSPRAQRSSTRWKHTNGTEKDLVREKVQMDRSMVTIRKGMHQRGYPEDELPELGQVAQHVHQKGRLAWYADLNANVKGVHVRQRKDPPPPDLDSRSA